MSKTVRVRAAALLDPALAGKARVPREGTTRRFITEDAPEEVQLTPYYQRKLASGELMIADEGKAKGRGLDGVITSSGEDKR